MLKAGKLLLENMWLKEVIKNELYKGFIEDVDLRLEADKLKKENKQLRNKIKTLKEIIKDGK